MGSENKLKQLLSEHSDKIVDLWRDRILASYSDDYAKFLKSRKNQFANPVGYNLKESLSAIFEHLHTERDESELIVPLDSVVKVRAIQDMSAPQAVSFLLLLKDVVRHEFAGQISEYDLWDQFIGVCGKIDRMTLMAFDIYMRSREKLYEIRANEWKRRSGKLLERNN